MRHFHAPVSFYIMSAVHALGGEERAQRGASSLAGAMVGAVTAGGLLCLGAPWGASLLAGIVVVADSGFITVTTDISPHPWYILFALSCLMLSAFTLRTGSRRAYIAAWVTFALSIATLEFAPLLVAAFVLAAVIARLAKLPEADKFIPSSPLSWMVRHLLILAALLVVIWPAGLLKGGYAISYGFNNLIIPLMRSNAYYGPASPGIILGNFFLHREALVVLCAGAVFAAAVAILRRKMPADTLLFGSYAFCAFLFNSGGRFVYPPYAAETVSFLVPFAALLWRDVEPHRWPRRLAAVIFLIACTYSVWVAINMPRKTDPLAVVVAELPSYIPVHEPVLVNELNDGGTYSLYLPQYHFEPIASTGTLSPRRRDLEPSIRYAIINTGNLTPESARLLASGYQTLRAYPGSKPGVQILVVRKRGSTAP